MTSRAHTRKHHAPRTNSQRMVMDLDARHVRCPVDDIELPKFGGWWFGYGYLQVKVNGPHCVCITNVWIDPRYRGRGFAKSMFEQVLAAADRNRVSCHLFAQQFDRGGMTTKQLWAWYERLGFVRKLTKRGTPYVNGWATRAPR